MSVSIVHMIIFAIIVSASFGVPALAKSPDSGNDCKTDTDCALVQDPCGSYVTTNVKNVESVKEWFGKNKMVYEICTMKIHEKPAGAQCGEYNMCEIVNHGQVQK